MSNCVAVCVECGKPVGDPPNFVFLLGFYCDSCATKVIDQQVTLWQVQQGLDEVWESRAEPLKIKTSYVADQDGRVTGAVLSAENDANFRVVGCPKYQSVTEINPEPSITDSYVKSQAEIEEFYRTWAEAISRPDGIVDIKDISLEPPYGIRIEDGRVSIVDDSPRAAITVTHGEQYLRAADSQSRTGEQVESDLLAIIRDVARGK